MITFGTDVDVERISLVGEKRVRGLVYLLHYLAGRGEQYFSDSKVVIEEQVRLVLGVAPKAEKVEAFSYERLNELLLLVDESRISRAFFDFFFRQADDQSEILLDALRAGVTRFRGLAMLKFGNFRFAFRALREIDNTEGLRRELAPWARESEELTREFGELRSESISHVEGTELGEEDTYLLGYVVRASLEEDRKHATDSADAAAIAEAAKLETEILEAERKARRNSSAYLASDYMDVYFATSMRQVWDFRDTYRVIRDVLAKLSDLNLRVFDPTQSHMDGVIEKGLVEALMLKRARCTVYLVQESDTLGKDSELAATLAQGKPVIAFVRSLSGEQLAAYSEALRKQPTSYYLRRCYALFGEDFFARPVVCKAVGGKLADLGLRAEPADVEHRAALLLQAVKEVRGSQVYAVLGGEAVEDQLRTSLFERVPDAHILMAAFDAIAFDRRAATLTKQHPLAMQVHLDTGVANGVLVVRDTEMCAKLLRGMLTNNLQFSIEPKLEPLAGEQLRLGTVLKEHISGSTFRYVTAQTLLSNAFWNFYLRDEDRFSAKRN